MELQVFKAQQGQAEGQSEQLARQGLAQLDCAEAQDFKAQQDLEKLARLDFKVLLGRQEARLAQQDLRGQQEPPHQQAEQDGHSQGTELKRHSRLRERQQISQRHILLLLMEWFKTQTIILLAEPHSRCQQKFQMVLDW
jgi:hypothetical protein